MLRDRLTPRRLAELIGAEKARLLMAELGGHRIPCWTEQRARRAERDAQILAELDDHATYDEVAERYDVSSRYVKRISGAAA